MDNKTNSTAGYKYLLTYQYAVVIYDLTAEFCPMFLPDRELLRQRDQMVQVFDSEGQSPQAQTRRAGRSGKQNIVEGYELQSLEGYIKFLGISKGSIRELQEDYEDFLRQRELALWDKDDPKMRKLRDLRVVREPYPHLPQIPHIPQDPELAANLLIMLCQKPTYLLEKQIQSLRKKFIAEGGFRENLFRQRQEQRKKTNF